MGADVSHPAKCFEGEAQSLSGLHRDFRLQAAGATNLVGPAMPLPAPVNGPTWVLQSPIRDIGQHK